MRNRSKLLLAALSATLVFGAFVNTASARRLALSNQNFRVTWRNLTLGGFGANIECPVTIEGSFHSRTLSKNLEQLIGHVTKAIVKSEQCTGGSAWILTTNLPWHIRYNGFSERLPEIREIHLRLILAEFLIQAIIFGATVGCLFRSTVANPMRGWVDLNAAHEAINLVPDRTAQIKLARQLTGICPGEGHLEENEGEVYLQGSSSVRITVTLVA